MENLGALSPAASRMRSLNNILAPIMLAVEIIQDDPTEVDSTSKLLETIAVSTRRGSDSW